MSLREPGAFRLIATLAVAGLLSGTMLVGVYLATEPRIERNRREALAAAILKVLPGASDISGFVLRDGRLEPDAAGEISTSAALFSGRTADGRLVGFAIPADGPGYMDTVKLLYGFDPARRVIVGMEVLDSRETPGLGDKIITDPRFRANFEALAVEPEIVPVKKGEKANPNEVDCITGATISSEAVVGILNRGNERWLPLLDGLKPEEEQGGGDRATGG